jgi:folate-binding protein YgfZ
MISSLETRLYPYRMAAWIRVQGGDAASYLQGQFTQDIRTVEGTKAAYGLWLSQKGKILADSFVAAGPAPGEYWVGSYFCPGRELKQRLEQYVVADDVEMADETGQWEGLAVLGPGAGAWIAAAAIFGTVTFPGRRSRAESWEWLWPMSAAEEVRQRLGAVRMGAADELERERILAGIPAVPRDAGPGDLPPEAGLQTAAISYTKGCYTGQEVIARLKSRGRVRRILRSVSGDGGPVPALPAPLWLAEKKVGELRSATRGCGADPFPGLAMVLADLPSDADLTILPETAGPPQAALRIRFCV